MSPAPLLSPVITYHVTRGINEAVLQLRVLFCVDVDNLSRQELVLTLALTEGKAPLLNQSLHFPVL